MCLGGTFAQNKARPFKPSRVRGCLRRVQAWQGYKQFAWGSDELLPVSKQRKEWHPCCKLGLTIVDSLDTLLLMGLTEEYQAARDWVENHLNLVRLLIIRMSCFP